MRAVSWLFRALVALVLLGAVGVGALAWRLSEGPLALPYLARLVEDSANADPGPTRLSVATVALAWESGDAAFDRPLDLHLGGITLVNADGRVVAALPRASVSVSLSALLLGRVAPRAIALSGLRLRLLRAEDGSTMLDLGSLAERGDRAPPAEAGAEAEGQSAILARVLAMITAPDEGPFGLHQLRRVELADARAEIVDRQLGLTWTVPDLDLSFARVAGGLDASGGASLDLGGNLVRLEVAGRFRLDPWEAGVTLRSNAITPAELARVAPGLAPLAVLDAPIAGSIEAGFDTLFSLDRLRFAAALGAGRVRVGNDAGIPIASAAIAGVATREAIQLSNLRVVLPAVPGGFAPTLSGIARATLGAERRLLLNLTLDRFDIAQLAATWPEGIGRNERRWLVPNVTAGQVRDVALAIEGTIAENFADLVPTRMDVTGTVSDATVHYLRPMPPVEDARGKFRIDLDTVDIAVDAGRVGTIQARSARVKLTSLQAHPQWADIAVEMAVPVADAVALVAHPRLKLFARRPMPVSNPTGQAEVKLSVRFPLLDDLDVDTVAVRAEVQLTDVKLPALVAGQDVTGGPLQLVVDNDSLRVTGQVQLAGMPARVTYETDFRTGPPTQVTERIRAELRGDAAALARLGLDAGGRIEGALPLSVTFTRRRRGDADAALRLDLRDARLAVAEAGFGKPPGQPASAEASLRMTGDRITALEAIRIDAPGLSARGRLGFANGRPDRLALTQLAIGNTRAAGEISFGADGALAATLRGAVLDLGPYLAMPAAPPAPPPPEPAAPGPPLRLDLAFDRITTVRNRALLGVAVRYDETGGRLRQLNASGRTGAANTPDAGAFEASLAPRDGKRVLAMRAADAGALLAALDVFDNLAGGVLAVDGTFDEPGGVLSGTATLSDFRVRDAPAFGRLLQGMTLYGLLDLARGPGLSFSQMTAPFSYSPGHVLTLTDARAFSPSLGLTAKGRIDRRARTLDMEGTVVPAYFFNSLLGNIPLIGRLFSPERGGGVFAATYSMRGPLDDPQVRVNPLAALTPGFLRGVFGIFDTTPDAAPQGSPPPNLAPMTAPDTNPRPG
jgi:hypothetical protein